MLVPAAMEELDEPHAALGQPPGQQAIGGERAGVARRRGRTGRTCAPARSRDRSARAPRSACETPFRTARCACAISGSPNSSSLSWFSSPRSSSISRRVPCVEARRVRQIQHRIAPRAELDALVLRGQKAAAPQPVVQRLIHRLPVPREIITHEGRQIVGSRCPGRS